jgi:hypothetical protein
MSDARVEAALRTLREIAAFNDSTKKHYELADRLRREFVDGLVNITPTEREQVATAIRKATNT